MTRQEAYTALICAEAVYAAARRKHEDTGADYMGYIHAKNACEGAGHAYLMACRVKERDNSAED